ncbi:MAG: hypothetical protein IPL39_14590 [Opitutaceae bacterium]|nr:hypothetical protein [Opitutaceae bacterium]
MANTLPEIITLMKDYAHQRVVLSERVTALEDEVQSAQRRRLPGIKSALAAAADAKAVLEHAIESNQELFVKPRTVTFHGIKAGLKKGSGAVEFADEAGVIARIKKYLKGKAEALIKTKESLKKKELTGLSVRRTGEDRMHDAGHRRPRVYSPAKIPPWTSSSPAFSGRRRRRDRGGRMYEPADDLRLTRHPAMVCS